MSESGAGTDLSLVLRGFGLFVLNLYRTVRLRFHLLPGDLDRAVRTMADIRVWD